jgi:hypothetical protein
LGKKKNLETEHVDRLPRTKREQENPMNYKSPCPSQGGAREHPLDIRNVIGANIKVNAHGFGH